MHLHQRERPLLRPVSRSELYPPLVHVQGATLLPPVQAPLPLPLCPSPARRHRHRLCLGGERVPPQEGDVVHDLPRGGRGPRFVGQDVARGPTPRSGPLPLEPLTIPDRVCFLFHANNPPPSHAMPCHAYDI